jgi:hypothetical protein
MATRRAACFSEDSTPEQRRDEKREAQQLLQLARVTGAGRRIEHLLNSKKKIPTLAPNTTSAPGTENV